MSSRDRLLFLFISIPNDSYMKETKQLQKALGMVGIQINDHQTKLVIEFMDILDRKGQNTTLGDIELISQRVQGEMEAASKIVSLK